MMFIKSENKRHRLGLANIKNSVCCYSRSENNLMTSFENALEWFHLFLPFCRPEFNSLTCHLLFFFFIASFSLISSFLVMISIKQIEKNIDGVLEIWTRGHNMVGADETTELWRPQLFFTFFLEQFATRAKTASYLFIEIHLQRCRR